MAALMVGCVWLGELVSVQGGVVSRAQVLACGEGPHDIRRRLRRREWATALDGIYVEHTGPLTWEQRAMAGVLHAAAGLDDQGRPVGAALAGHAALRQAVGPGWRRAKGRTIDVAIDVGRSLRPAPGYRFVRCSRLADYVEQRRTPPRIRLAEATAELVIAAPDDLEVVQVLADACQSRLVAADQVRAALLGRGRVPRRRELLAVVSDVAAGTCSALEHRFVTGVVRAHGLPAPEQQRVRVLADEGGRRELRDCEWERLALVVELDGRQFHDTARQRDRDLDRDLDDAAAGRLAVRLGWGQVTRRRCRTARRLATLLASPLVRCAECQ